VIYLLKNTDDTTGDPDAPKREPVRIPDEVQTQISELLSGEAGAGLPAEIIWVESIEEVPYTKTDTVEGGGALIRLGNIIIQTDGSAMVSGSLEIAALAATGKTYILNSVDGNWKVTGNTGVQWMR
jgi:hypothetical protein